MLVSYKLRGQNQWTKINNYELPLNIFETADDTFNEFKLTLYINGNDNDFDNIKSMPPKTLIQITDTTNIGYCIFVFDENQYINTLGNTGVDDRLVTDIVPGGDILSVTSAGGRVDVVIKETAFDNNGIVSLYRDSSMTTTYADITNIQNGIIYDCSYIYYELVPTKTYMNEMSDLNTYYFTTTKVPKARIRKEIIDENDDVITPELIVVELTGLELIKTLEDKNLSNYTITQPKNEYYNKYRRFLSVEYNNMNSFITHNGVKQLLNQGNLVIRTRENNTNADIVSSYNNGRHTIRFNNIENETYSINGSMLLSQTARLLLESGVSLILAVDVNTGEIISQKELSKIEVTIDYYNTNNQIIKSTTELIPTKFFYKDTFTNYQANGIIKVGKTGEGIKIARFPNYDENGFNILINKHSPASYCVVSFELMNYAGRNKRLNNELIKTDISGVPFDDFIKSKIDKLSFEIISNPINDILDSGESTLLEFLQKVLYDYNFNRREKITLSNDLQVILDVSAKESEWSGYDFRELVVRICKYVNVIPKLSIDNELSYIKSNVLGATLDINQAEESESSQVDTDYYDTILSSAKNVVSNTDFTFERVPTTSGDTEFSQITDNNISFLFSNDIYYVKDAYLYTPTTFEVVLVVDGVSRAFKSNTDTPGKWNITKRLFEKDLYFGLPNVNFQTNNGRGGYKLSQGNTLYFTSGSNKVLGLGHKSPNIPTFSPFAGTMAKISQYAVIETLICLAFERALEIYPVVLEQISDYTTDLSSGTTFENVMLNMTMDLEFVAYHKEITTKYITNKVDRGGLNYQKRMNVSDRVIDYKENESVLRAEMNRKGNTKYIVNMSYEKLDYTLPIGTLINNGKYKITSKNMGVYKNMVDVDYVLEEGYMQQNTDVGLSIEYDRYNVPFEYVNRELQIENHLLFSKTYNESYSLGVGEVAGCTTNFIEDLVSPNNITDTKIDGYQYAKFTCEYKDGDSKEVLMRLSKLEGDFSMILKGSFVDNYSAGMQRYHYYNTLSSQTLYYSQPFSYVDYLGGVESILDFKIGYTPKIESRVRTAYAKTDFLQKFPDATQVYLDRPYYSSNEDINFNKDAREMISVNYHTYLETIDEDIKWYSFKGVDKLGTLNQDLELNDELKEKTFNYTYHDAVLPLFDFQSVGNTTKVSMRILSSYVISENIDFTYGVVLLNQTFKNISLVGIIKKPTVRVVGDSHYIDFYIHSTRYGKKE